MGETCCDSLAVEERSEGCSPIEEWQACCQEERTVSVTEELIARAKQVFERGDVVYLHHAVAVAFPELPTVNSARRALRQGRVRVDGEERPAHDALVPSIGAQLTATIGVVDKAQKDLPAKLAAWNSKSQRAEAQIYLIKEDRNAGWAVVNKPAGMHCRPCDFNVGLMTLEGYLQAVVRPPLSGTKSRGPRACHRLDFRVCGPVLVATSEEAMRSLKMAFELRHVHKEYRAIVCGSVGPEGKSFSVDSPLDGEECKTLVEVLKVVGCPHYGSISELSLRPVTGRHQQLRRHCAEILGAPIVNDEPALFEASAAAWERRTGQTLPPLFTRGGGNLFLQAVEIAFPDIGQQSRSVAQASSGEACRDLVSVRIPVSSRFLRLMNTSARAYAEGWRSDSHGKTFKSEERKEDDCHDHQADSNEGGSDGKDNSRSDIAPDGVDGAIGAAGATGVAAAAAAAAADDSGHDAGQAASCVAF
eukprot:TRINITY_DN10208_c0_g1_i1.p1 TRINITY_DN10208_c0_g1~~TRINITY_DN10208_c0_g1_i1.p1  ORF type:complete len:474 (-),score=106.31 TRINITY_DN10208_c0_g1_i1:45-1466(-)